MTELIVRIDSAANMRRRPSDIPEPAAVAVMAELGGADAVAAHLREDRSVLQERDLRLLREILTIPLILEMTATSEMIGVALEIKPDRVFLVSKIWGTPAAETGLDLVVHRDVAAEAVRTLTDAGIPTGLAVSSDLEQVKIAHRIEACAVQLDTSFAENTDAELFRLTDAVNLARKLKLPVIAGADLSAARLKRLRGIEGIDAFVVGQGLVAAALMKGMPEAVREFAGRLGFGK